jgi:hypothetical protein
MAIITKTGDSSTIAGSEPQTSNMRLQQLYINSESILIVTLYPSRWALILQIIGLWPKCQQTSRIRKRLARGWTVIKVYAKLAEIRSRV